MQINNPDEEYQTQQANHFYDANLVPSISQQATFFVDTHKCSFQQFGCLRFAQNLPEFASLYTAMSYSLSSSTSLSASLRMSPRLAKMVSTPVKASYSPCHNSAHISKSKSLIEDVGLGAEEISSMESFVEEIASDPAMLYKLIDFQEIINNLRTQHKHIQHQIAAKREILLDQRLRQQYRVKSDKMIKLKNLKQQEYDISLNIQSYNKMIQNLKEKKVAQKQARRYKLCDLNNRISEVKSTNFATQRQIKNSIIKLQKDKQNLLKSVHQIQVKRAKLDGKLEKNEDKKREIVKLVQQINKKKKAIVQLKKQQTLQLERYKDELMRKKTIQSQAKRNAQKNLTKFVLQLAKIVDSTDRQGFLKIIETYESKKLRVRRKKSTSDTIGDEDQEVSHEDQLNGLQKLNPTLKSAKNINIKSFQQMVKKVSKESNIIEQLGQCNKQIEQIQSQLAKITNQQTEVNTFVTSLREKDQKIDSQIKEASVRHKK